MRPFNIIITILMPGLLSIGAVHAQSPAKAGNMLAANRAKTVNGVLEGKLEASGIRSFKGVPFAAPPVGGLRWREPQPAENWEGVRSAESFGPRAMQLPVFGDMSFRADSMSEDCLYLNIWTPAKDEGEQLPVLVYFYGGGFVAGDGSEARYDGESMARKGIVSLTVNYRLGIFGFFAHPELSTESPHNSSGNYGYLDQHAALQWVKQNIAAFGGDPNKITIAGESAGSISVSAHMASPLSKGLIAGAIGESGAMVNSSLGPIPLDRAEENGANFATSLGAPSLRELRSLPAQELLEAPGQHIGTFSTTIDGYFLPKSPAEIFAAGEQAKVPLLAGWNSEEMNYMFILGQENPSLASYEKAVRRLYGENADSILQHYQATTDEEALQAATELAGDRFIAYSTWKWIDLHRQTSQQPVYRYLYSRPRPPMVAEMGEATPGLAGGVVKQEGNAPKMPPARGAVHSAEIEYAMGNLATNKVYDWTAEDYKVSAVMQNYFANFIKAGNPNGPGLPKWPPLRAGKKAQVMHIDVNTRALPEQHRERYLLLDHLYKNNRR